jgi:signal peptidase II
LNYFPPKNENVTASSIILIVDQVSKIYITKLIVLGEEVGFKWFKILFIENEEMAWGTEIPGR